ncbi:MAG: amidohydrolase [Coriobacteriales bacterium]|jgi:5-methylthioadenosine/S-adenosylhomocysteine deaminase|nr:amidohydrolase [Coriobacteriales bacterium]
MKALFYDIDYLDSDFTIQHGYVLTDGAIITYVGPDDPREFAGGPQGNGSRGSGADTPQGRSDGPHELASVEASGVSSPPMSPQGRSDGSHEVASGKVDPQGVAPGEVYSRKLGAAGLCGTNAAQSDTALCDSLTDLSLFSGRGCLLIPGLYNQHTHIPMTLLRGYAEGLPLDAWLNTRVFPFEAQITPEAALPASELAIAEMLRFGVVSFADMYNFSEQRIRAVATSGIKANISYGPVAFDPDTRYEDLPACAEVTRLISDYHESLDGRLRIDIFVHSEYLSNQHIVQAVGEQAFQAGVGTHIHLSETEREHQEGKQRRGGLTPCAYFDSLGFFRAPCTAAHCVWTEPDDWQIMASRGVSAVLVPASNAKLGSGFAPVTEMLTAGVNVTLGTDGVASNNNHNLFKEIYLTALLAKGLNKNPLLVSPTEVLSAATIGGARAQGRRDAGRIEVGARADLVVLDVDQPWMQPAYDQRYNLVYSAQGSDVILTMVDGEVLYSNGEWTTIDVSRAAYQTRQATGKILAALDS